MFWNLHIYVEMGEPYKREQNKLYDRINHKCCDDTVLVVLADPASLHTNSAQIFYGTKDACEHL